MKRLFLLKQKNIFLMIKNYVQFLITSFQKLSQTQKTHTHSLLTITETFEKHPSIPFRKTIQVKASKVI